MKALKVTSRGDMTATDLLAITAALAAANGKAESFTITDAKKVVSIAKRIEAQLEDSGVTQKNRVGVTASFVPEGPGNSYRFSADSTKIELKRVTDGWRLISVKRTKVFPGNREKLEVKLTAEAREDVVLNALSPYAA